MGRLGGMSVQKSAESSSAAVDRGQMLLIALVVLALIASVIMLITDSNSALKLALLAALWAAIIGFFLVTRYRRQAERSQDQLKHERELHQAESDKAEAERQAEQEKFAREYQEKQRAEESETLAEIQQELEELRANLEVLSGREFGYEPAALRAQARRIMELETETAGTDAAGGRQVKGAPSTAAVTGLLGQTPKEPMRREDVPVAPETAEPTTDEPTNASKPKPKTTEKKPEPLTAETRAFDSGSFTAVKWDAVGAKHVAPDAARSGDAKPEPAAAAKPSEAPSSSTPDTAPDATDEAEALDRRGRRRRDERQDAVSVADLLANLNKKDQG